MSTNTAIQSTYPDTAARPMMSIVKPKLLTDFIYNYTESAHRSNSYKALYRGAADHLSGYAAKAGQPVYTNTLSEQKFEDFVYYLQADRRLMSSTVKSMVERVKCMLNKADNAGLPVNGSFRNYSFRDDEIDTIFLTMADVTRIYYFKGLTSCNEEIRDCFVVGCMTGLRYSDYSRLTADNFVDGKIQIRTKKTKTPVLIPMHPFVREIVQKYDGGMPPVRCIQYFNIAIKKICRQIGFTGKIPYDRRIGTEFITAMRPKYSLISSHTARRSAATNMFLSGIQTYRIMLLTGHKTESAFFRYIRITREENAMTLAGNHFFNLL